VSCCHPVIETPAPAVTAKKSGAAKRSSLVTAVALPGSLLSATDLWPALVPTAQSTPPPVDVVIVFSRLTI
jgi:hypothetical protein